MRLSKGKKAGIVIALTVVLLVVDQVTKILVKTNMHLGESDILPPDTVRAAAYLYTSSSA